MVILKLKIVRWRGRTKQKSFPSEGLRVRIEVHIYTESQETHIVSSKPPPKHTHTYSLSTAAPLFILFSLYLSISPSITHPLIEVPGVAIGANKELLVQGQILLTYKGFCLPATYYAIFLFNPSLNWHCKLWPLIKMFEWWMYCILWILNNHKLCLCFIKPCRVTKCLPVLWH